MFSRRLAFLAVLCVNCAAVQQHLRGDDVLQALENKNFPDAELDGKLPQQAPRRLQEEGTVSPSSAPTPSPDGEREFELSLSPTPVPSPSMGDFVTEPPAPATATSGASSWRPSAGVASALAFVGSVAAAAVMS